MSKPSLFLVSTPIGNLGDITIRGLETLKSVDTILAEDTRTSGTLLKHYEIAKPLQSFHIFNEHKTLGNLIKRMQDGEVMALITDAGTPGISDPGFLLVRECLKSNLKIESLPGATAFVPALVKSGFPTDRFVFEGFLPLKKGRQTALKKLAEEERTIIFYESPVRLVKTLGECIGFFGAERLCCVSRELTKLFEENKRGSLQEVHDYYKEKGVKGEVVVIIQGKE